MAMFFDYVLVAGRLGIAAKVLEQLEKVFNADFPDDKMMAELHILRAVLSIERGDTTIDEILNQTVAS